MCSFFLFNKSVVPPFQETTNYHFDVSPKDLKGALDRFAQVRTTVAMCGTAYEGT